MPSEHSRTIVLGVATALAALVVIAGLFYFFWHSPASGALDSMRVTFYKLTWKTSIDPLSIRRYHNVTVWYTLAHLGREDWNITLSQVELSLYVDGILVEERMAWSDFSVPRALGGDENLLLLSPMSYSSFMNSNPESVLELDQSFARARGGATFNLRFVLTGKATCRGLARDFRLEMLKVLTFD